MHVSTTLTCWHRFAFFAASSSIAAAAYPSPPLLLPLSPPPPLPPPFSATAGDAGTKGEEADAATCAELALRGP